MKIPAAAMAAFFYAVIISDAGMPAGFYFLAV